MKETRNTMPIDTTGCRQIRPEARRMLRIAAVLLLAGCGRGGAERYDVSGKVTFNGAPVPAGVVIFDPAVGEGNDGLQGFAEIDDGRYTTRGQNKGITGGRYHVRIRGFARAELPDAQPRKLFDEYHTTVDFSDGTATHDFDVPASAASNMGALPPPE